MLGGKERVVVDGGVEGWEGVFCYFISLPSGDEPLRFWEKPTERHFYASLLRYTRLASLHAVMDTTRNLFLRR